MQWTLKATISPLSVSAVIAYRLRAHNSPLIVPFLSNLSPTHTLSVAYRFVFILSGYVRLGFQSGIFVLIFLANILCVCLITLSIKASSNFHEDRTCLCPCGEHCQIRYTSFYFPAAGVLRDENVWKCGEVQHPPPHTHPHPRSVHRVGVTHLFVTTHGV
jgi:hypothetical protein